jgi:hypothetical protein
VIIGKLIPAGTGLGRYRNVTAKIRPEAIPEYWLARQREQAEMAEAGTGDGGADMTEQEAREALLAIGGEERREDEGT